MNATGWVKELEGLWAGLKGGKIKPNVAAQMNLAAGKVIAIVRLELEHARMVREFDRKAGAPKIQFLAADAKGKQL